MRRGDSAEQCFVSAREHRGEVARLHAPSSVADAVDAAVFVYEEPAAASRPDLRRRDPRAPQLPVGDQSMRAAGHPRDFLLHRVPLMSHCDKKSARWPDSPRSARRRSGVPPSPAALAAIVTWMPKRDPRMIPLGYGKFVRADRVFALVPLEGADRRDGRRTYVHVDGLTEPVVASRSERAILADVETALAEAAGLPRRRRAPGQESLL